MKARLFCTAMLASLFLPNSVLAETFTIEGSEGSLLQAEVIADFDSPWAMTFLPNGQMLVTTKPGKLYLVAEDGTKTALKGVPEATVGGQGGLGDIVPHPDYPSNQLIYFSLVQSDKAKKLKSAVVMRARLRMSGSPRLEGIETIWTQIPKGSRGGHFSHRLAFGPKGSEHEGKLFITSGDRQQKTPAQDWDKALGKIVRLNSDGSVPKDNPFQDEGKLARTFWTTGHRNVLGIAFDGDNRLWASEMGPAHGDELNLIEPGLNYGWPIVSNGDQYNGTEIPDHDTRPEFAAPKAYWVPSIAPAGLVIYSGDVFSDWKGNAFLGGLVSRALVRVELKGEQAREVERFEWNKRVREVEQGPDGHLWILEDRGDARLLKISPKE